MVAQNIGFAIIAAIMIVGALRVVTTSNVVHAALWLVVVLAGAAAPTALFALGITLVGQPIRSARAELGTITVLKLVIHPLLMAAVMLTMPGLDMLWIQTAILFACLPVAANVFALSEFYQAYSGRTATSIMLTTLIASVSVPATLYALTMLGKAG